jgi:hypothetical protein
VFGVMGYFYLPVSNSGLLAHCGLVKGLLLVMVICHFLKDIIQMEVDNTLNLLFALVMKAAGCHIW